MKARQAHWASVRHAAAHGIFRRAQHTDRGAGRRSGRRLGAAIALALGLLALGPIAAAPAAAQTLPQYGDAAHLGVQTCGGSTCHGAVKPWQNSAVLQNEFITWKKHDAHSQAYAALKSDRGRRIARNLGLGDPTQADICLDCHTDNVPENKRSKQFDITDGVVCESCHGGAENWLGVHVAGTGTHADNVAAGMYPTEDPEKRAELCLSCHYGDPRKFLTHRIMGAGHPRLVFELDTYTAGQPAHFRVDDDYRQRKDWANAVKTWAVGQAVAVRETLAAMADPKRNRAGIFPELVFFDCHACHHPMSNLRWQPQKGVDIGPGVPRLNDANLVMLRVVAGVVDEQLGRTIEEQTRAMHQASREGREATQQAVAALRDTMDGTVQTIRDHAFRGAEMTAVLNALVAEGLDGGYGDYADAEQATMAIASVASGMERAGVLKGEALADLNAALEKAYDATSDDEAYTPERFVAALKALDSATP